MTTERFVAPVAGPEPTAATHLATKNYVDSRGIGGLKSRDVGVITNLAIGSSGIASQTVQPPESAPTDGTVWTWLPASSHTWRSVNAAEGDLVTYQLRALVGNGASSFEAQGNFDVVIMNAASGTPKRWLSAAEASPLVPAEWGPADMQFFSGQWNVHTMPPVVLTVRAGDISSDGKLHVTLGYKPLATDGYRIEGTQTEPGQVWLLNYGNGVSPGVPVPQHGALSGLTADDHPQYHNDTRGDARYPLLSSRQQPNGLATLDGSARVPLAQLPTGNSATTVAVGNHNHNIANLAGVSLTGLASGDVLAFNGTAWANSNRVSILELLIDSEPTDTQHYGDVVSSIRRNRATNLSTLDNGYWTFSTLLSPKGFTATKVRFYVASAGVAGGSPTVALALYDNGTQVATVPVSPSTFTAAGIKDLTLSSPINVVAGRRYTWLSYIAPSSFTTAPGLAFTAVYYSGLNNPTPSLTYNGYKSASTMPPATINTADGTWSANPSTLWWALL